MAPVVRVESGLLNAVVTERVVVAKRAQNIASSIFMVSFGRCRNQNQKKEAKMSAATSQSVNIPHPTVSMIDATGTGCHSEAAG
jgi:hypothetical protein